LAKVELLAGKTRKELKKAKKEAGLLKTPPFS
jgi:hypothetical protein